MTTGETPALNASSEGKKRAPVPRPKESTTVGDTQNRDSSSSGKKQNMGVDAFASLRINDPSVVDTAGGLRPKLKIPAPLGVIGSVVPGPVGVVVPGPTHVIPQPKREAGGAGHDGAAKRERGRGGKKGGRGDGPDEPHHGETKPHGGPREPREKQQRGGHKESKENGEAPRSGKKAPRSGGKSMRGDDSSVNDSGDASKQQQAASQHKPKPLPSPKGGSEAMARPPAPIAGSARDVAPSRDADEQAPLPARQEEPARPEQKTIPKESARSAKPSDLQDLPSDAAGSYVPPSRRGGDGAGDRGGKRDGGRDARGDGGRDCRDGGRDSGRAPLGRDERQRDERPSQRGELRDDDVRREPKPEKKEKKGKKAGGDGGPGDERGGGGRDDRDGGPKSLAGKEIRRFIDSGNVEMAMAAFDAKAAVGGVDADTARALLAGLVKACHLHEALHVSDYLKERKLKIPLKHFTQIILSMSQRANPMDALDLLNALEGSVSYGSKAIHNYHFHFAKLIVQEFLEEALQTLDRVANAPAFGLQENGLAAMDVVISSGGKGGAFSLNVPALGMELQRGLMKGDTVLLSRTGEAARTMGSAQGFTGDMPRGPASQAPPDMDMGAMPTGPRGDSTSAPVPGRGGRAGGGWRADFEFEAEVSSMHPNLSVKLIGCDAAQSASVRGGGWRVDKLANRTSFVRQLTAIQDMMEVKQGTSQKQGVDAKIRDVLVAGWDGNKQARDSIPDMCAEEKLSTSGLNVIQRQKVIDQAMDLQAMSHMNKSQTDALEAALFQRVTLIQGPPGTGKTHTAVALVQMWLRSRTSPILCTSDSNIAVDNLVDGLSRAGVRVARVGRPEAVRQDLMQYMVESIAGIEPGCVWSKDQQYQAINGVLRRAEVICATCAGAGSDILERFSFEACLIDEATQATEPATIVPLTKGCRQVVLIGDQKQLPPTIISREADAAGLGTSLFERMLQRGIRAFMLKVQYRMHPAIAAFPSKAFYKGELLSGTPPSARRAPMGFDWPVPAVPLAFVDVPEGVERSDGSSQTNPAEAQKIVNIVKKLIAGHDVLPCDIGIVTPYAAQVRAIKTLLTGRQRERRTRFDAPPAPDSLEALEVSTVDGFQGREKEVIVFTCTRANGNGNVGFLADPRRVNVMLTRARRGLIVVGHHATLRRDNTVWGPWLAWASENGLVCGVAATDAESAARLATMGMSSLDEIGGRGAGEVMQMGALLSPNMAGWGDNTRGGGNSLQPEGPKLKARKEEDIPDAWDDSDSDDDALTTTDVGSVTVKGSTNSLTGMADGAWGDESDDETAPGGKGNGSE